MATPDFRQVLGNGQGLSAGISVTLTNTGSAHTAGNPIFVVVAAATTTRPCTSVVDSAGNTYTPLIDTSTLGSRLFSFISPGSNALTMSGSITAGFQGATASLINAWELQGMSTTQDCSGVMVGSSTTPRASGIVTAQENMEFGFFSSNAAAGFDTTTESASFNLIRNLHHSLANLHLHTAYRDASASGSVTYAPTLVDASAGWVCAFMAFPNSFTLIELPGPIARRSILPLTGLG